MLAAGSRSNTEESIGSALEEIRYAKAETAHVQMTLRSATLFTLGWLLVFGGIVGLFLPIVPGAVLILAGVAVLSPQFVCLRRALGKCRERFSVLKHYALCRRRDKAK